MMNYNSKNERIKKAYFEYLKDAKGRKDRTIDNKRKAIDRFELYTKYDDFRKFNKEKARAFKRYLESFKSKQTDKPISKSTYVSTLLNLKDFFLWLRFQKGYKKIDKNHIEYFNPLEGDFNMARSKKAKEFPTLEQIKAVLASMPNDSEIQRRDRALIAFTALTAMRDGAIASLKLKHIHLESCLVEQLSDEVNTKFSKTIYTYFFPVGDDIKQIVIDWIRFLREVKLFGDNDPMFPRTKITHDENFELKPGGLEPIHWQSANQIRKIFKKAFKSAGLPNYTPHSFRNTLTNLGLKICNIPEDFKAWSQNLGHNDPLMTFTSYGNIETHRQGEIILGLKGDKNHPSKDKMLEEIYWEIKKSKKSD